MARRRHGIAVALSDVDTTGTASRKTSVPNAAWTGKRSGSPASHVKAQSNHSKAKKEEKEKAKATRHGVRQQRRRMVWWLPQDGHVPRAGRTKSATNSTLTLLVLGPCKMAVARPQAPRYSKVAVLATKAAAKGRVTIARRNSTSQFCTASASWQRSKCVSRRGDLYCAGPGTMGGAGSGDLGTSRGNCGPEHGKGDVGKCS